MKAEYRKYTEVQCRICDKHYSKRNDSLGKWRGCCSACKSHSCKEGQNRPEVQQKKSIAIKEALNRMTPEVRKKRSELARAQVLRQGGVPNARKFDGSHKGSNHPCWKGGITPERVRIYHSKEYQEWRTSVFERDDYTCQLCGKHGGRLHADHIKPYAFYPELRFDINNGRTLCVECHKKTPTYFMQKFDIKKVEASIALTKIAQ